MKITIRSFAVVLILLAAADGLKAGNAVSAPPAAVIEWSNMARRAIVPAGPNGIFGSENFGNKFPGEAAVYMGIVHTAIYDTAVAIYGGYRPYAIAVTAPADVSVEAAIATTAHHVIVGLQPALGLSSAQQALVDHAYTADLAGIPDGPAKSNGIALGEQVAAASLALRANDGRDRNPQLFDLSPPIPGPGVWTPGVAPAVGLRLPGIRPLALTSADQFRPDGPNALTSAEYASDFEQVKSLGRFDSTTRTPEQTTAALFWTDHDLRQWNDAMLRLATERGLDLMQTSRMLAMAHTAGGDAMIACFDAKYTFWFWRPYQAIPQADTDGNDATVADPTWQPLRPTPNFPEFPSAHACHSTGVTHALSAFFGTDRVPITLDSRVTGTTRAYAQLRDVVRDVDWDRVLAGFHFRNSDQQGTNLGRKVGAFVVANYFQPANDGDVLAFTRGANAQSRGMFVPMGDMTTARAGHSATLLLDGTVLIAGGDGPARLGGVPARRSAELYDPATGTFAPTGNMIEPRYFHTATLLPNGKVLIVGGSRDTTAELYDPSTRQFSLTGPMGAQQQWLMATLLGNGKVLVAGSVDAELYDPATESFAPAAPYAALSRGSTATLLADGRVLFVGDDPAQLYDSVNNSFSITDSLSSAGLPGVDQQTATLLNNGKVLITGGSNDEVAPAGRVAAAELYDPATGAFTATSAMHSPRDAHAAILLPDGNVLIVGGDTGTFIGGVGYYGGSLASAELYDPSSGTFSSAGSMNAARTGPQATLLKNGDVLITGGFSYCGIDCFGGSLATAELYHPPLSRRRSVHPQPAK